MISNDAFITCADEDWCKHLLVIFNFSDSLSCLEKKLKAYVYGQEILSKDDAANNLVALRGF